MASKSPRSLPAEFASGGTITQSKCCAICGIVLCPLVAIMCVNPCAFLGAPPVAEIGPLQAINKHSFHSWRGKERREALSISGAERSRRARKRARRGFGFMRRAELHKRD